MLRQSFGCCQHSMNKELTCRKCHGTYRQRGCSGVLLFGLLFSLLWSYGEAAIFSPPDGCSSVSYMQGSEKVQNITCINLNLTEIPSDVKNGRDVIKFVLSNNLISTLQATNFVYFTNLAYLDLAYNGIQSIPVDTFYNLTSLTHLSLAGNNFSEINEELFTDSNLEFLDMSYNPLLTLPTRPDSSNLIDLDMSYNPLLTLPTRPDSSNLIVLNISHCNILSVEAKHLDKLILLEELDASYNNISSLERNLVHGTLKTINFSHNQIDTIDRKFLDDADSITNLNLSHNKLTSLASEVFEDCPNLENLYLSNNNLSSIPSNVFDKTSLKTLELGNNHISTLPGNIFDSIAFTIQRIDLSHNSLTSISSLWFANLQNVVIDLSGNPFVCDCTTKEVLYTIFNTNNLVNVDLTKCRTADNSEYVFMDYNNADCPGYLGSTCAIGDECMVRNSICTSSTCTCEDGYYDNNGADTDMGLCKKKIELDYPCDHETSCKDNNAECVGIAVTTCQCTENYYDTQPIYFEGMCKLKKELGESCSWNAMCRPSNSQCNSTNFCACTTEFYDDTDTNNIGGVCRPKIDLYGACNETYQCGTANAKCSNNVCTCKQGYYDLANNKQCLDAASFFSCYLTETSETEIIFTSSSELLSNDACEQNCFRRNEKYYTFVSNVCLCGNVKPITSTSTKCCPKVNDNCDARQYATNSASLASADISIGHVPKLYYGTPHEFTFSTSLVIIDEVRIGFGDSQELTTISASSGAVYHTYTYPGEFWVSVYGCVQAEGVCDVVRIPVWAHVPSANLSTYITGRPKADVSESLTSVYATVPLAYNADFYWTKTINGIESKKKGCVNGWISHRTTCIKLVSTAADYSTASASCVSDGGRLLKLDHDIEREQVVTSLSASSTSFLLGAQRSGGEWKWQADNSKTFFKDSDLTSSTNGDCLILDGATSKLTSASCSTSASYACMTDPVSCPHGGKLMGDYCYLLVNEIKSWSESQTYCNTNYNGWLAKINDVDTHSNITNLLVADSISKAWFGLHNSILKGSYLWADDSSYDLVNAAYKPTTSLSNDGSCFVTNSTNGWEEIACTIPKEFVCQYSTHLDRITVPSYVSGINYLAIPSGDSLQQLIKPNSFPSATATSYTVQLFPGMPFTRQGRIRSWAFQADVTGDISLQHYVPKCTTGTLYQPGCASTMFATCSSSSHTCTPSNTCQVTEQFCYLSNTCKAVNESCTCNSEVSSANAVNSCSSYGAAPSYELVGQTKLTVTSTGAYITSEDISVNELDLIGIQYPTGSKVIKCDNIANGVHEETSYQATVDHWLTNSEPFPSAFTVTNETCYLQAITSEDHWENLTAPLAYSTSVGNYGLSASLIGGVSRSLSIQLEESAENIAWVYPQVSEPNTTADSLGTIYTELNTVNYLTIRVERGTDLTSTWTIDGSITTVYFSNSIDASVEAAVPNACNASMFWSDQPCASLSYNSPAIGTTTLSVLIYNDLGATTKTLDIKTEKRISGVTFSMATAALQANNVAINKMSEFETVVTDGTGLSYSYTVNGAPVTAPITNSSLWYNFPTLGTYTVNVTVSNILGSETRSVTVYAKHAAEFTNCNFVLSNPTVAAVGIDLSLQVQCELNSGSEVSTAWELSDRSSNITQAVSTVSSSPYTWVQAVQFSTVQNGITAKAYIMDPFESITVSLTIDIYNAIPYITFTQNVTNVFPNEYIQFHAEVPASPGSYGSVEYIYEFGDSTVVTYVVGTASHRYMTGGNFTVKVTATNGPSNQSKTSYVTVYEPVTGLNVINDGPKAVNTAITFNASTSTGNFLTYRFESTSFNVTQSSPSYTFTFSSAMDYTVKVTAYNELSSQSVEVIAYILSTTDLRISSLTVDGQADIGCFESKTSRLFKVDIIFYDADNVVYDWDLGNGMTQLNGLNTKTQQYNLGGNYTVIVVARYPSLGISKTIQKTVCVQERITNPSFSLTSPVPLPSTGAVNETVSVTLGTGTNSARYQWSTNATYLGSVTESSLLVTFSSEGFYSFTVNVSNEISYIVHTSTIQVIEAIDGLQVTCTNCPSRSGDLYVLENNAYTFSLSSSSGSGLTISWNFGDGTTGSGNDVIHTYTYTVVNSYTITVTASNSVSSSVQKKITVYVQKDITNVILLTYGTNFTDNIVDPTVKDLDFTKYGSLKATVLPAGMHLLFRWQFDDGLPDRISSNSIESYQYNTTGLKNVTVSAENEFGSRISSSLQFYVIQKLTASSITENGTLLTSNSHMVLQNTNYQYTMSSSQIVDHTVNFNFVLRKGGVLEKSVTTAEFFFDFPLETTYTLKGTIQNSLGSFAQDITIEVVQPLAGPGITADIPDGNLTLGASITLKGSVTQGKNPLYTYTYVVAPSGETIPTHDPADNSITLTPGTPGQYIVTLEIHNAVSPSVYENFTINVMVGVSGVSIDFTTTFTNATLRTSSITFSAVVVEGTDRLYSWNAILSNGTSVKVGNTDTFTVTFEVQDIYNVTLQVENYASSIVKYVLIHSLNEVPTFNILPSVASYQSNADIYTLKTNQVEAFSQTVLDTSFLSFQWSLSGSEVATNALYSYNFSTAGSYDVSLNVSNRISYQTQTIQVVVQDELKNFDVTSCNATSIIGNQMTISATYAGTDVTVEWSRENHVTTYGNSIVFTYQTTGIYSMNVTAENYVSSQTLHCFLNMQGVISDVSLNKTLFNFVGYAITFTITGNYIDPATFTWTFPGSTTETTTTPSVDHTFTTIGAHLVSVTVANEVSSENVTLVVNIEALKCGVPSITVDGNTERTVRRSRPFELTVNVEVGNCNDYTSKNEWLIYSATSCEGVLGTPVTLDTSIMISTPTLKFPKHTLAVGTYCVLFNHIYEGTPVLSTAKFNVTVVKSRFLAVLNGNDFRMASAGSTLTLDARSTSDPDDDSGTVMNYEWKCSQSMGTTSADDVCTAINNVNTAHADLTGLTLNVNDRYDIAMTVYASGRDNATAFQTIQVVNPIVPIFKFSCISCEAANVFYFVNSGGISLQSECSTGCTSSSTYQWKIMDNTTSAVITIPDSDTKTGFTSQNFVLKPSVLQDNKIYKFQLEVTDNGQTGSSYAAYVGASSPSSGSCSVTPTSNIIPLSNTITTSCTGVTEADSLSSIYYKIIISPATGTEDAGYIAYYGTKASNQLYVVPSEDGDIAVTIYAVNDFDAETFLVSKTVKFTDPTLTSGTKIDYMINKMVSQMKIIAKKNSPSEMLQYCLALLNYLNRLSEDSIGTASQRMALRDVIIRSLDGLPLSSLQSVQQMASALDLLTKRPSELSSSTTETVLAFIESLKDMLKSVVVIGMKQENVKPDSLISAINNVQTALNITVTTTSNTTVLAMFDPDAEYVLSISSSLTKTTYSSESARVFALKTKAIEYSVQLLIVSLTPTLSGEDDQMYQFGESLLLARHVPSNEAHESLELPGMQVQTGENTLSHIGYTKPSVFQYALVNSINPYQSDASGSLGVNTLVVSFALHDTTGDQLEVANLPDTSSVKMYIFVSEAESFDIDDAGLIHSTDYNPLTGMKYSSMVLSSTTKYGVDISHPGKDGVSIHIQVRANFTSPDQTLKATLLTNNSPFTFSDGSNYELTIDQAMMSDTKNDHRLYTFFIQSSDISVDDAVSVKLKSSSNLTVHLAVYYSECGFYDVTEYKWSNTGCQPQDESIASVICCKCNHTTSFGGSLLVSPDQLDFTDLSEIDFSNNPVAIITCSVILFMYIVLVIAFKRLDIMDLKRISLIPLCGKDGSFKYEVTVITGRLPRAGTTAHVGIRLIGEYGKSVRQHVSKPGAFQRNCSDTFIVAYDVNLGDLRKIQIWHDNSGTSPSWYLGHVIVNDLQTDKKYYFFGDTWLTLEDENGSIQKEIKVAGSHELTKFTHRMKTAAFNALADKHLWLSLFNRPAQSRFTRAQRVTCCVTVLYVFVGVNAMWYGLLKKSNTELGFGDFGWEELVLALVSNVMVLPISVGLVFLFKKSRSKPNFFAHVHKPQTAQTLEIENLCGNSQGGSFESDNTGAVPYDLERESTIDSVPHAALGLHRSRHVAKTHRENTDDSLMSKRPSVSVTQSSSKSPLWNEDGIMKWPDSVPGFDDGQDSRPSTCSTMASVPAVRQSLKAGGSTPGQARKTKKGEAVQLLEELDKLEQDLKENESQSGRSGSRRTSTTLRRPTMHKSSWGSLEDILNSDDESVADSSRLKKRGSTTSQSTMKKFNPRADPRIHGNGHDWPKSRESLQSASSAAQPITAALRPGYYSEMTMESRDIRLPEHKEKCTLPPWCIYIGYTLCFILSVFSVIIVILYCFKFGYNESVEWVLALILSLILSVIIIEPLKALLIAVYVVAMFRNVEQDEDEDFIDIEPTYDSSNEKIKDVKFKPISGFALLQAKEEGRKIHRMKILIRQFIAYIFYLWLIMVIVYINFRHDSYLMTKHVEHDIIAPTTSNHLNFTNITSIDEFWDWTENVFVGAIHKENLTDQEHGLLLGAPRLRLIRGITAKCEATDAANNLGVPSLTQRICHGEGTYNEDTKDYSEGWNESNSNYSWKYYGAGALGSTHKVGHVATYGGGGYPQVLGTTMAETDTMLTYLKDNGWIDLQTRAIIFEFALYSAGSDMTSMVALLAEFPLTGGVITSYEIQSQKLLWFQSGSVEPQMILEVILFLVIVYSVVHISLQIREHGKQFFKEIWNWFEMLTTLMALVSVGIYIGCVVEATNAFNNFLDDLTGFTNFERAMYVHIAMRYLHAWLLFLLMFKVVKQLRFIKFMFKYEQTLSKALGHLFGSGLIYIILLVGYALVGYSMFGRVVSGFESVGHSIVTLIVMIRGNFDFWPMLDHHPVFSHFYVYSYYAFAYGILMGLVIAILTSTYKVVRSQMYYTSTLEMQDYEMIEFMMKRFKLWAGFQKQKPAFRRVRFPGLPSISSRSSSSYSNRSEVSLQSSHSLTGPQYSEIQLRCMLTRLQPTWQAVLKRMDKILALDDEEENLVKRAENEMKDLNWKCRINELERQHKELLSWKDQSQSSGTSKPPIGDAKQRQSILKRLARKDNHDRQAPATVTGAQSRTAASTPNQDNTSGEARQSRRPLSDQGARVEPSTSKGRSSSSDKSKLHSFFKSIKPSKSAWNK